MPIDSRTERDGSDGNSGREAQLIRQLSERDAIDLIGVIDTNGMAGAWSRGEEDWTLLFCLAAWRYRGEPVQKRKLTVRKKAAKTEIDVTRKLFGAYDVVHMRARVAEDNVFGTSQALLIEIIGKHTSDEELNKFVQELQKPVTFQDNRFGTFTLDRRVNWFEAQTSWGGTNVRLRLSTDGCSNVQELLSLARSLWDSQVSWSERISNYAVAKLLKLKNETWLEEDEEELSAEQFKTRMTLESIDVYPNRNFEFWYDDGDLFFGHSIMVSANLREGPTNAGIHG
jgi:hypothetical protein